MQYRQNAVRNGMQFGYTGQKTSINAYLVSNFPHFQHGNDKQCEIPKIYLSHKIEYQSIHNNHF